MDMHDAVSTRKDRILTVRSISNLETEMYCSIMTVLETPKKRKMGILEITYCIGYIVYRQKR